MILPYLVAFWGLLYFGFVVWLLKGWQSTVTSFDELEVPSTAELLLENRLPTITVVVPFRNEAANLPKLIGALLAQDYPAHLWQAVLVNDHSDDTGAEIVHQLASAVPGRIGLLSMDTDLGSLDDALAGQFQGGNLSLSLYPSPKKRAILAAIASTTSDIILTTDADCELPKTWLSAYGRLFGSGPWQAISGPVRISDAGGLGAKLQSMEFGSLVVTGAATLAYEWPTLCNGANLAYRRDAFFAVDGFAGVEHQPSGDDEFLWHKLGARYPGALLFGATVAMAVTTTPANTWSQFVNQRVRWASKWDQYQSKAYSLLAAALGIWHLVTLLFIGLSLFGVVSWASIAILLCNKLLADYLLLSPAYARLGIRFNNLAFVLVGLLYPFYAAYFALRTLAKPSYQWKGRNFGHA